jgi:hypothetical protein
MYHLLNGFWIVAVVELAGALGLSLLPRLGRAGRGIIDHLSRAYWLDLVVALLTWVPWLVAGILGGWAAVAGAVLGQVLALFIWGWLHEWVYREAARGPRIVKTLNRLVGRWQNHAAIWITMIALPGFWFIRLLEIFIYPALVWLLKFPRYRQGDWVNVSRQKFSGLVGHDLIWCLYCDWMTGVYALGAEMLRNVESFWCPIRFYDGKKCANCRTDFPDLDGGWVDAAGTMAQVAQTLETHYAEGDRSWFGHPARLTVKGKEPTPPG